MIIIDKKKMTIRKTSSKSARKSGFTLIELSIVLVIIGLIVGGVLTGQDLIKAAQIRATVSQYENYNTAVNTFQTKYNGIPGDLNATSASAFGFVSSATPAAGKGDGNGLIDGAVETVLFWNQLSASNLLGTNLSGATGVGSYSAVSYTGSATIATLLPLAKLARGNYWTAGALNGLNYYGIGGITGLDATATGTPPTAFTGAGTLTPLEAYNIDVKIDDGNPTNGIVTAVAGSGATYSASAFFGVSATQGTTQGNCIATSTSYNTGSNTVATYPSCSLQLRFN